MARVEGLCASIATVIMCACERIVMDNTSFCMIHNCWTQVQGDSNELRKQADVMDKMNEVMMSFYKSKFDLTEEELKALMDAETWFSGSEAKDFKLNCEVIEGQSEYKIAASISEKHFKNIPKRVLEMKNKAEETLKEEIVEEVTEEKQEQELAPEEEKKVEEVVEEVTKDETTEEQPEEEPVEEEKTTEELKKEIETLTARVAELEKENEDLKSKCGEEKAEEVVEEEEEKKVEQEDDEVLNKAQVQARISGIQSSMQKQINDFKSQLKAKEEELINAKADVTRLTESLEKTSKELSEMASAFEEKQAALDKLNSNVNAQAEELPTFEEGLKKCSSPAEKVAFIRSGKYTRQVV